LVYAVANVPSVQTYLAKKLANYLAKELKTEVQVGAFEIEFPNSAILHQVLINDLHHDTLIYAGEATLNYLGFFEKENRVQFSKMKVANGRLKLKQYKGETDLNIDFFVDFIDPPTKVVHPPGYVYQTIASNRLTLENVNFSYVYEKDTLLTQIFNSSDIHFNNIYADVEDFKVLRDTVSFHCNSLSTIEKCGLSIRKLDADVRVSPAFVTFDNFKLKTAFSDMKGDFKLKTNDYKDYNNFEELVYMNGTFDQSTFDMRDAAYFNETVEGWNIKLAVKGELRGTESNLKGKNLDIQFGEHSTFKGNVSMKGLPNWENTFTHLEIDELITNNNDIERIQSYPFSTGEKIDLPREFEKLGAININGTFTGFESDFVANAYIKTDIGDLETDLEMKTNDTNQLAYYKGNLKTHQFNLGAYYSMQEYIGKISLDVDIDGHGLKQTNVNTNIKGIVSSLYFNEYAYQNIRVDGNFSKDVFDGKFLLDDPNAKLDFIGLINLKNELPQFVFKSKVEYANLSKLGIAPSNKPTTLSTELDVDITGDDIDNLVGKLNASNTIYSEDIAAYQINELNFESSHTSNGKKIALKSDFANGYIQGNYTLMKIGKAFKKLVVTYIPSIETNHKIKESISDNSFTEHFDFDFTFLNSQPLTKNFLKQVEIMPNTKLKGHFYADVNDFSFTCKAREMKIFSYPFHQFSINASPDPQYGYLMNVNAEYIEFSDSSSIEKFSLNNTLNHDSLNTWLKWKNNSKINNSGNLNILTSFQTFSTKVKILQNALVVQDSLILIKADNELVIDSTGMKFYDMVFAHGQQSVTLNSESHGESEELNFTFKNFAMNWFNPLYKDDGLTFNGALNGNGVFGFSNDNLIFTATASLSAFAVNNELLGDGSLVCVYNDEKESVGINGKFLKNDYVVLSCRGFFYPYKQKDNLDLEISLDKLSLKYAETYTEGIFSNLSGYVSGDLVLKGSAEEPVLEGKLDFQKSYFKIDYMNTGYSFNGSAYFSKNKITFKDVLFTDVKGNKGRSSGVFTHYYFDDLKYDINVDATKLMCLNTSPSQNSLFYGKAFASGNVRVKGDLNSVFFDIAARSEKGTFFVIPLYGAEEIEENNFITFVNKDTTKKVISKKTDLTGIEMHFELELTDDADIQMMFDPKVGDAITGSGYGNIKMDIDTKGNFTMFGAYTIHQGNYLFTLQNVINRKFTIENGGTIQWTGDPFDADININAVYSLKTTLPQSYQINQNKNNYKVDCKLLLTEKLMKPNIKFEISLPTADQTTRDNLYSVINASNEAELNKQVFSLLMLGSFFPGEETNSVASATAKSNSSELLSNQMNNWLAQTFKGMNLNLKYSSASELTNREIAIAASKQLFNNRLSIDGTFGYSGVNSTSYNQNPSTIIGDVNIDYKVTQDGKFRMRAFNRSNDYTNLLNTSPYIQGVGIIYREDFDKFSELRNRFRERQRIKYSTPIVDTLQSK
jgi:hypothetical protein